MHASAIPVLSPLQRTSEVLIIRFGGPASIALKLPASKKTPESYESSVPSANASIAFSLFMQ